MEGSYYERVVKADPEKLARHHERAVKTKKVVRDWLAAYKLERGCADCGYKEYACALQLDHTGPKTASISEIRTSVERMENEIMAGKCVVRCANCHSIKTWKEKNGIYLTADGK